MNLTSIISTAAGGWIPWAANAATQLAGKLDFSALLSSSSETTPSIESSANAGDPEFPLSASDRDRLERLVDDDLGMLAQLLRGDPRYSAGNEPTFDVQLDASGAAKITAIGADGSPQEVDLSGSDELNSLLRRMASCLRRLTPAGESSGETAANAAGWNLRVDRGGARLVDSM